MKNKNSLTVQPLVRLPYTQTHTRTHTHTSGRQLNITLLDVLDYSEYSDTISKKKIFHENIAFSVRKQKEGGDC